MCKSSHVFLNLLIFTFLLIFGSNFRVIYGARTYYRGPPRVVTSTTTLKPTTSTQKPASVPLIYSVNESCEIPSASVGTDYSVYDPTEHEIKYKPGARAPKDSTLTVDCKSGYLHQDSSNSYLSTCNGITKAAWHPVIKECLRVCKPIRARNIELTCTFRGQLVNCSYPLLTGTEVEPTPCQPQFKQSFKPDYQSIKCLANGEWDNELFQCIADGSTADDIFSVPLKPSRETETSECVCPRDRDSLNELAGSVGSCEIPQHGPETKYTVYSTTNNEIQAEVGSQIPRGSALSLDCENGFLHEDGRNSKLSTCSGINDIFWNPPITHCKRVCKPLRAYNVAISCTYKGQLVNCSNPLLTGTEVQPADCEPPFHRSFTPDYRVITCQENGEWDNMLFKCLPDCGKPHDSEKLIFDGTAEVSTDHSPWNIAIYDMRHSPPLLICGGTIISPLMVISAAHCFYIEDRGQKEVPAHYKVVTGKVKRDFSTHDTDSQTEYEIREIQFSTDNIYHPASRNYAADIAILVLRELISFNFLVLPACMDWLSVNRFSPRKFKVGKLYGWGIDNSGFQSEVLRTADLPYISYNECLKKVNTLEFDKFCAGYDQGAGARKGDSGAGLLFENENDRLFYLRGIVSSRDKHTNTSIAKFTDITFHITWLQKIYKKIETELSQRQIPATAVANPTFRPSFLSTTIKPDIEIPVFPDGLCEIPASTPDKSYTIRDAENNQVSLPPGTKVPESYTILFQCNDGYLLKDHGSGTESKSSFSRCVPAGIWNPPIRSCSRICETVIPPLYATLQCVYDTKSVNCGSNLVAGTLIYSKCDPMFHYEKEVNYSRMTCQENGKYDVVLGDCIPDCGKSNPTKLVFGRNQPEKGEDPWNVAIYNIRSEPPELVCSGTIVSPLMVLSAAHCFGNVSELSRVVATDYQVVVGKITRDYRTVDTNWQKAYDVREINFADRGQHPLGYFAADIAVLIVRDRLKFDRFVLPACVDWRSTRVFNPGPNATGRFIGWGWIEEFNRPNDVLAAARLNFMSLKECKTRIKNPEFDTFCALAEAADEACKADSGGGLVFPTKDRTFYLRGIIGENDYENEVSVKKFTDISKHIDWLYEIFEKTSRAKYALRTS